MSAPDPASRLPPHAIAACFDEIAAESFAELGGEGRMAAEARHRCIPKVVHLAEGAAGAADASDVVYAADVLAKPAALGRAIGLARRRLVLAAPLVSWRDVLMGDFGVIGGLLFGAPCRSRDGRRFSEGALRKLLNRDQAVFEPIRIIRDSAGTATVVADKRRIGHMVVICAPTSGGKSTIAQRLVDDADFRKTLGVEEANWEVMKAEDFFTRGPGALDHVIVMYNLLRRLNKDIASGEHDPLPLIFDEAERLTIVTLITPSWRLREQFQRSEMPDPNRRYSEKILRLQKAYQRDDFLKDWYRAWFGYQESLPPGRAVTWMIVFGPDGEGLSNIAGWRDVVDRNFGATP
ncbi:MAG: hypothetical protein JNJ53_02630 [Rhizobiales bacterium]|nr:hypothetical protein [Hyphomicrobiales bacterium]